MSAGQKLELQMLTSFHERLFGLHGRCAPNANRGVWLRPCAAIHTLFLPYAIDVVFLDASHRIIACRHSLAPNRCAWHWKAASVVELQAGYCATHPDYAQRIQTVAKRLLTDSHAHRNTLNH